MCQWLAMILGKLLKLSDSLSPLICQVGMLITVPTSLGCWKFKRMSGPIVNVLCIINNRVLPLPPHRPRSLHTVNGTWSLEEIKWLIHRHISLEVAQMRCPSASQQIFVECPHMPEFVLAAGERVLIKTGVHSLDRQCSSLSEPWQVPVGSSHHVHGYQKSF